MTSKEYEQSLCALDALRDAQRSIRHASFLLQWDEAADIDSIL